MMSKYLNLLCSTFFTLLICGCSNSLVNQSGNLYTDSKSKYPREYTEHFPVEIPQKGVSFNKIMPAGVYALHYWGFQLFIQYENEQQKVLYLENAKSNITEPIIVSNNNLIFLTSVKEYCDSTEHNIQYNVYPFPNIQQEIQIINEAFNNEISFSNDWNNYSFYLIESKDTIVYEEQHTNICPLLQSKIDHGFSRGVVVNENDKILFFWVYFW